MTAPQSAAKPGTILAAWQQIARLLGREDTSPASVVDAVAYFLEQRAAVLAIHRPVPGLFPPSCQTCREHEDYTMWPCDTAAALGVTLGGGS